MTSPATTVSLSIEGMTCASCVGRVERVLKAVPGVAEARVNLATERGDVVLNAPVDRAALVAAIEGAGFSVARTAPQELLIEGMTCASCVARVERALGAVPGVEQASVNLATERAQITGSADPAALLAAVEATGFSARLRHGAPPDLHARRAAEARHLARQFWLAAALTLPVFVLEMGGHIVPAFHHWLLHTFGTQPLWLAQFALTTAVLAGPGRAFYTLGLRALGKGAPDMNSLVALGTAAAWAYSVVATFGPSILPAGTVHVYYEAAAVIVTLILAGRWMEARAKGRTSDAIRHLMALQVPVALVRREGGTVELPLADVAPGDLIEVRPGGRLPVDGVVVEGESYVDESMISGEPVPVAKAEGAVLTGGTVNQNGALLMRASAVGGDTVLARIIRLVEEAQGGKLPIQALVDRVTLYFVPAVMAIAALTFALWLVLGPDPVLGYALVSAVAVLIIACPCAMGLATPVSIMVATGRAAELGVLFRKGEALQSLRDVRVIAFDKTGTLTEGRPELTDLEPMPGFERARVLAAVAAIEQRSEHPVARAIVQAAEGMVLPAVSGFESVTGMGVRARVDGLQIAVGADRFMRAMGVDPSPFSPQASRMGDEGKSPLYVAFDGRLAAILAVSDPLKPEAVEVVAALHAMGLRVAMITGDNRRTAQAIARRLGIDAVEAEVLPEGKLAAVRALRAAHGALAFVGDGINDAPALAEADVGLAIGTGTDVAIEAADVVLMAGHLRGVTRALALSRAAMRNIRQNLFWAFAYNTALIPVAAGVLYPAFGLLLSPVFAAGAMALSSVFVVGNALRLRRFQPERGQV